MSELKKAYLERYETALKPLAAAIDNQLREYLASEPRIDRITARAKSVDRFLAKAAMTLDGVPKYSEPLRQIQDQVGARIVSFYVADIDRVSNIIRKYYKPIEMRQIVPESEWEFGYFGTHYVLLVPSGLIDTSIDKTMLPEVFELQVKTLFQHAWSEANHDLGYKPGDVPLDADAKRRLAFTSAQAWGADRVFDDLFRERSPGPQAA